MRGVYILRVKAGKEKAIAETIKSAAQAKNLTEKIFEIYTPFEEKIKTKRLLKPEKGKMVKSYVVEEMLYKGYIFIDMVLDEETFWFIRSIPGIKNFVGRRNPVSLPEEEVAALKEVIESLKLATAPKPAITFQKDERVRIIEGPLSDFIGVVEEVNEEKAKLKLSVFLFGRSTPVEVDFTQVEKI